MPTLNPCPICGKQPVTRSTEGHYPPQYKLFCGVHVSVGDWFPNTEAAEKDWNRRTTDPMQPDLYKPTRADRIRAMNDKEMAHDLIKMIMDVCEDGVPSEYYLLEWLTQPAEAALDGGGAVC